jgi:hypothetical protein
MIFSSIKEWRQVKTLLYMDETLNPSAHDNDIMKQVCIDGRLDIVQLLLRKNNLLSAGLDEALLLAIDNNNVDIVRVLLADQRVILNPSQLAQAFDMAMVMAYNGERDIFKMIYFDSRLGNLSDEDQYSYLLS